MKNHIDEYVQDVHQLVQNLMQFDVKWKGVTLANEMTPFQTESLAKATILFKAAIDTFNPEIVKE